MRAIDSALQAELDGGATTLCRCWRITRTDGVTLGFTDHDAPLDWGGVTYEADCGLEGMALERATGLAADDAAVLGALSADGIDARDIDLGRYDGAAVELWLVDWRAPARRHLLFKGAIGRIERNDLAFTAEVNGLSAPLNRPVGRAFLPVCDAELGDQRCGVDLGDPAYRADGVATALEGDRTLAVEGLDGFAEGWFTGGRLIWTEGALAGRSARVRAHLGAGAGARLELWAPPPLAVSPGDRFTVLAGCDKRFETCREKFSNHLNFRGFPHLPGDDWVASYPVSGEPNDGGSRYL